MEKHNVYLDCIFKQTIAEYSNIFSYAPCCLLFHVSYIYTENYSNIELT